MSDSRNEGPQEVEIVESLINELSAFKNEESSDAPQDKTMETPTKKEQERLSSF